VTLFERQAEAMHRDVLTAVRARAAAAGVDVETYLVELLAGRRPRIRADELEHYEFFKSAWATLDRRQRRRRRMKR
jgi:hypothetical protein